ncbi:MAG: hypothetical protein ABI724_02525 [Betaproteobacteria bacterium]
MDSGPEGGNKMGRIERLIWEEAQLDAIKHTKRESRGLAGAKVAAIVVAAIAIALLGTRMSFPHVDEVMVQALSPASIVYRPMVAPNPTREVRPATAAVSHDAADKDDP